MARGIVLVPAAISVPLWIGIYYVADFLLSPT
jgi:hypothetical protein